METGQLQNWAWLALVVVGGLVVGGLLDLVLTRALRGAAQRTGSRSFKALSMAMPGQPEIWTVIAGLAVFQPMNFLGVQAALWGNRITIAALVLSLTLFVARLATWLLRGYLARERQNLAGTIFLNLARIAIWAVGLTAMLGALGVEIGPLIASLGVAGLAVSLGLQDTLSNFFSGMQISMSPQFEKGHFIRLIDAGEPGTEGVIEDVTWRDTTIKTLSNDLLIVPNSVLAKTIVQNFTGDEQDHVVWVRVDVAYDSDLDHVEKVTLEAMRELIAQSDAAEPDTEPVVRFMEFAESGITLQARVVARRYEDRFVVLSAAIKRLHRAYGEAGIEIPFPQTTVHIAEGSSAEA